MNLLNRGAHTHYSQREAKTNFDVNRFAELSAYIKETLQTAVSAIEGLKSNVTNDVTAIVSAKLDKTLKSVKEYVEELLSSEGFDIASGGSKYSGYNYGNAIIYSKVIEVNIIGNYDRNISDSIEGNWKVLRWVFWDFDGNGVTHTFNSATSVVSSSGATVATHKAYIEIFYIEVDNS